MRAELTAPGADSNTQESEMFIRSDGKTNEDCVESNELPLADGGWLSPPLSVCSGSSESITTSAEASIADCINGLDLSVPVPSGPGSQERGDYPHYFMSNLTDTIEPSLGETASVNKQVM